MTVRGADSTDGGEPEKRRRTADETRKLIIDAAGKAFATRPYRDITLKDIAEEAGVSAPLIIKYFGSKEQLYEELVDFQYGAQVLFEGPLESLGERMVAMLARPLEPYKPLSMNILFMSGGSEESNRMLRDNYSTQMIDALAARLSGTDARLRAELAMSAVMGLAIMRRRMMQERATGTIEEVVALYAPLVQALLDGDVPPQSQ
ncbi:TetR family transcriptional regulator [Rhodococcus sp. NPDC047139]|uniref:TetR/AcrR family transcriptional regulator n=1 Tax=Rhodococcus sp. NPDC047139 TaxID=3155141 RepID=UPI0033E5DD3F